MNIVATCVRDHSHEKALSKLGRNLDLLQGAQDGDVKRVSHALHDGAEPEIRQAFVLFGRDKTLDDLNPDGKVVPTRPRGPTALMLAAKSGSVACLQMLLEFKANVSSEDEDGLKPVHYAAMSGELGALACLVQAGADILAKDDQGKGVLDHLPPEVQEDVILRRKWEAALKKDNTIGEGTPKALDAVAGERRFESAVAEAPEQAAASA